MKCIFILLTLFSLSTLFSCKKNDNSTGYLSIAKLKTSLDSSSISHNSVIVEGYIAEDGNSDIVSKGVCWSTSPHPTIDLRSKTNDGEGIGKFKSSITGLVSQTTYYVRAYAINSVGVAYGNEIAFTTSKYANVPIVITDPLSNITYNAVTAGGEIIDDGGEQIISRGVCWSTSHSPTVLSNSTNEGIGVGAFTSNIYGLTPNTTYYLRAYASNNIGVGYGNELSFTTPPSLSTLPNLAATLAASNITSNSAVIGGRVISEGSGLVYKRGVCYSESSSPTIDNFVSTDPMGGVGDFVVSLSGLAPNTKYYARSFATNSYGTSYGSEVSFTTQTLLVAKSTVLTSAASSVTSTSAICGGEVTNDGGGNVTEKGIILRNISSGIEQSFKMGSGVGIFSGKINGLSPNTKYSLTAYAINSSGTSYGSTKSFTTLPNATLPSLDLPSIKSGTLSFTSVTIIGNVLNDGGVNIVKVGVCWSTTPNNPGINSVNSTSRTGNVVSYVFPVQNLTAGTVYYVWAYALNSAGYEVYSQMFSFVTNDYQAPTVTTNTISVLSGNAANVEFSVTNNGGMPLSEYGLCLSTSPNVTINDIFKSYYQPSIGDFGYQFTNLNPGTKYYVMAYAINAANKVGTGQVKSFTTTTPFSIGQTYQGGTIVYLDNTGIHGLIASPADLSYNSSFFVPSDPNSTTMTTTGAVGLNIGTGLSNTNIIVNVLGLGNNAASVCKNYKGGGYSDWFLPSINELKVLYNNKSVLSNIYAGIYWSSSEKQDFGNVYSYNINFSNGFASYDYKWNKYRVRAMRKF